MSTSVLITLADKTLFAPTRLEVTSVLAVPILPVIRSKDVLILMNVRLWRNHVEIMQLVRMPLPDTTVFVHKVIVQNLTLKLLVNRPM